MIARDAFGNVSTQPVIWTGKSRLKANRTLGDVRSGSPIRTRARSLADDVPHQDLLIKSEYAVFLEGHLDPARMLVNGRTISSDRGNAEYDYFHLKTARQGIVRDQSAASETLLDNGLQL